MEDQTTASEYYKPLQNEASLQSRIDELEEKETEVNNMLDAMDRAHASRREPFEEERTNIAEEKKLLVAEMIARTKTASVYPPAPGPAMYKFVDSGWFNALCNIVVVFNLTCMALSSKLQAYHATVYVLDQLVLVWYVLEIGLKWQYHRHNLFRGSLGVVWWNWLDAAIVVGGVLDQWVMLLVQGLIPWKIHALSSSLRWLRLFRIMRFLKVLRGFAHGDTSWTEKAPFQLFMSIVIGVNSVVLTLELDYDWAGWSWFEEAFLLIYTFELLCRLKHFGWRFFINADFVWNNLDFSMVCGGAFDLWLLPAWRLIQSMLHKEVHDQNASLHNFLKILKMAKILRVLRLVRLLRMIKPLYHLLIGVLSALDAMKWVLALTLFLLYAASIVFTSLIGHGYIYDTISEVPPEAEAAFANVPQSFFTLFKMMNGDTTITGLITEHIGGQLLFAAFMILSNWAVLAILTSVVSDHMISASQQIVEDDKTREEEDKLLFRTRRLRQFFEKIDEDKNGKITPSEWEAVVDNLELGDELCHLTNLNKVDLKEVVHCLSGGDAARKTSDCLGESFFYLEDFITHLNEDKELADRRQILHHRYCLERITMGRIQELEDSIQDRFAGLEEMLENAFPEATARQKFQLKQKHPQGFATKMDLGMDLVNQRSKKRVPVTL